MFLTSKRFVQHTTRLSKRLQFTVCFAFTTGVLCVNHIQKAPKLNVQEEYNNFY